MAGGARLLLLIAVAALALGGGAVAQARPSQGAHDAARKAGASHGTAAGSQELPRAARCASASARDAAAATATFPRG